MYTVLIVDDEEPVLESYSYLVDSALDDFTVGGTARSGSEAISVAREQRPDVVLMDIAMPGIDGIDTIRELQHEFPDALYILSTAYERFDLAQRAIPLRVFAYLVKPVSKNRLVETMFRAKDELDEHRERLEQRLEEAQHGAETLERETETFMVTLSWKPFDETSWSRARRLLRLPSDQGVVVAVAGPRELYDEIGTRLERRYRCLWSVNLGRMILFVSGALAPDGLEADVVETVRSVAGTAGVPGAAPQIHVRTGSRRRYDELYRSFDEAVNAIPVPEGAQAALRRFRSRVRELGQAVARAGSVADVESLYETVADEVFSAWAFPVAKQRIAVALERLLHDFDSRVGEPALSFGFADPINDVLELNSRRDVDAWAHRVVRRLVEINSRHAGEHWPAVLKQAVHYMDTRFAEPLQLTTVAEHCEISAGYLSRLLSEHLRVSFNDYLNQVRIAAAQRLLRDGEHPVKEIAYAVGYHDPNYFSRIFKKFTGVSPSSYEKQEEHHA